MNLTSVTTIKELMSRHGLRPSRNLGQNFFLSAPALETIVEAASPAGESCLEIGPGLGTLTRALATRARTVTAVEISRRLEPLLAETLADLDNVRVLYEDFLRVALEDPPGGWVVAANLPYVITTPALFRFLDGEIAWKRIVVTVQAELAERLVAPHDTAEYGALSVAAQSAATIVILRRLPSSCFWPRPRVESAIVLMTPRSLPRPRSLRALLRAAFSARRKTLWNALAGIPGGRDALGASGLDVKARPETLSVEEWMGLAGSLDRDPTGAVAGPEERRET